MLKIGYVRFGDARCADDTAALKAMGCHAVRLEEPSALSGDESPVLSSILEFIGDGDQLVVRRLETLGHSARSMLEAVDRLAARGASLSVVEPQISTAGEGGSTLRAVLQAMAVVEPAWGSRKRRAAPAAEEIRALQDAGVGPVEIARRLGVSRMTVWRKMRALDPVVAD